jgi:hypothetical protein
MSQRDLDNNNALVPWKAKQDFMRYYSRQKVICIFTLISLYLLQVMVNIAAQLGILTSILDFNGGINNKLKLKLKENATDRGNNIYYRHFIRSKGTSISNILQ